MIGGGLVMQSSGLWAQFQVLHETISVAVTEVITLKLECSFSDAIPRNKADAALGPCHTNSLSTRVI